MQKPLLLSTTPSVAEAAGTKLKLVSTLGTSDMRLEITTQSTQNQGL